MEVSHRMDDLTECIKEVGDDFSRKILHYPSKNSLISRLREEIQEEVGGTVRASAHYDSDDITVYKQDYIDKMTSLQSIQNVILNGNIGTPDDAYRHDLAILTEPDCDIEVTYRNGAFYYPEKAVETAIICKYIRAQNTPDTTLDSPDNNSWGRYSRELEKLTATNAQQKHFVIFNTRNIFQQSETDDRSTETAHERYETLVEKCSQHGIQVHEFHPEPRR